MDTQVQELECKSFKLFKTERPDEFKRLALYITFKSIELNPGVTLSRITWELGRQYQFEALDVSSAVGALSGPKVFDAVSVFRKNKEEGTEDSYLRVKRGKTGLVDKWIESLDDTTKSFDCSKFG